MQLNEMRRNNISFYHLPGGIDKSCQRINKNVSLPRRKRLQQNALGGQGLYNMVLNLFITILQ